MKEPEKHKTGDVSSTNFEGSNELWRRYEFIVNTSRSLMTLINKDYAYEVVNDAYCLAHDRKREDLINRTVSDVWGGEVFGEIIKGHLDRCLQGEEIHYQAWFKFKALGLRYFDVSYHPYRNASGEVTHAVVISHDMTEMKLADDQIQQSFAKLQNAMEKTIDSLASTIGMRDPYTANHQRRVTKLACALAREMNLSDDTIDGVRLASLVHDIGKMHVPAEILSKPGKISDVEFDMIETHCRAGYDILKEVDFPWPIAEFVLQHHERLDGSGYPSGLKGDSIFRESRIIAVADVVEAMSSHRPYRPALGMDVALDEIVKERGTLYDSEVVDSCVSLMREKGFTFEE
jgi:putative nucleotidyltransferase with HDIG domain/PAS domain S-box-containing protein